MNSLEPMLQDVDDAVWRSLVGKSVHEVAAALKEERERIIDDRLNACLPWNPYLGDPISKVFEEIHEGENG